MKAKIQNKKRIDSYADYLLLEYRQVILRGLIFACVFVVGVMTIYNIFEFFTQPASLLGVRNLILDGLLFFVLLSLAYMNKRGNVTAAGWIFGIFVFWAIPETYSIGSMNQAFLIMALPVLLASFTIRPWAAFPFMIFAIGFYTFLYFCFGRLFQYDFYLIGTLFSMTTGAYVIASSLNKTIAETAFAYEETIRGWAKALEMRDAETLGHSERVVDMTIKLAKLMRIAERDLIDIRRGVLIHDLGKMAVPDAILSKPGKLTEEEWVIMRKHPEYAHQYLSEVSYLGKALDIPYCHHEKWDGTGYPRGLIGEQIPLHARIFSIVDVWDALISDRCYRDGWSEEKTLAYIREQSGKHFDPQIVPVFEELIKKQTKPQRIERQ